MKQILAIFDFCETIVDRQSIPPFLELARKANSAYRSPNSYKQRLLRKAARLIYTALLSRDWALGEQCGSVAPFVKGTNAKFANLPQKAQSSHSPTAIPRILEEDKQAERENQATNEKADSSNDYSASAESMDCHAIATALARNDKKHALVKVDSSPNDSKICGGALRVLGQFGGGSYLSGNDYPQIAPIASNCSPKAESLQAKLARILTLPTYPELAGLPLSTALTLAQSYALSLRAHSNQKVIDRLLWHKAQGHAIVVVSGGLGIYIRPFMQEFGIETILAVELESTFDKCGREILSGNRAGLHTMHERKLYALANALDLAQYDLPNSYAYSDCPSDVPLLSLVGKPCVVQGSQETRWAKILGYPILVP